MSSLETGLNGKVVIITGASSGIGKATAIEFAKNGCKLTITGRREDALKETTDECVSAGVPRENILEILGDLEDVELCRQVVKDTISKFQRLDVLVNSAGGVVNGGIETLNLEDYDKQMNINCRSVFVMTKEAVPHLKMTKGNIVNISSVTGLRAFPGILSYCMSKSALDQFTRCCALDLAQYQVRCNAINPGVIITNVHKAAGMDSAAYEKFLEKSKTTHALGRVGEPEEVAKIAVFLGSNVLSGFMTGNTVPIDGGRGVMCPR